MLLFVLTVALAAASAYTQQPAPTLPPGVPNLSPQQAQALIQKNGESADFVVLDVRTPAEFEAGHLAGAVNVDFKAADFQTQAAKLDRTKSYLAYCRSGHRSRLAVLVLHRLGITHLYHLEGGITAWQRAGLPIELPAKPTK